MKNLNYTKSLKHIELVLKISSRCNLNCPGCYYFNSYNQSAHENPATIPKYKVKEVSKFLKEGAIDLGLERITIDLHGGESLLISKSKFSWICDYFLKDLGDVVEVKLGLQTNATLVDEDWIKIFEKYNISVGASLDGPEVYNDEQRIFTNGQGSYGSAKQGIIKLRDAHKNGRIPSFGLLCVINPKSDGREVYNHFVNDLEVKNMDFLFPAMNHDDFVYDHGYEKFMGSALDAWIDGGFKDVSIRKFSTALLKFSGINKSSLGGYSDLDMVTISFTIQSNGDLGPDDLLFQSPIWNEFPKCNVTSTSLYDYLSNEQFEKLDKELRTIPEQCTECCWSKICGGGGTNAVHLKYSSKNNSCINPTVYCDSMKELYSRMCARLLDEGVPYKKISEVLCLE